MYDAFGRGVCLSVCVCLLDKWTTSSAIAETIRVNCILSASLEYPDSVAQCANARLADK